MWISAASILSMLWRKRLSVSSGMRPLLLGPRRYASLAFAAATRQSPAMSATIHRLGQKPEPSLEPMLQLVAHDLNLVNAVILDRMQSDIPLIPELAGHLIAGGGKRMRPMLTLASARL